MKEGFKGEAENTIHAQEELAAKCMAVIWGKASKHESFIQVVSRHFNLF